MLQVIDKVKEENFKRDGMNLHTLRGACQGACCKLQMFAGPPTICLPLTEHH